MPFLKFFQDKVLAGIALFLGPGVFAGSLILHAYALHDMGLPIEIWVAIGLLIFSFGVVGVLYKSLSGNLCPCFRDFNAAIGYG
jgi:hypothetical protein